MQCDRQRSLQYVLNNRSTKCLDYLTPFEIISKTLHLNIKNKRLKKHRMQLELYVYRGIIPHHYHPMYETAAEMTLCQTQKLSARRNGRTSKTPAEGFVWARR